VRLLFVKHELTWPRTTGHDVHAFSMMRACAALGHEVALATCIEPEPQAVEGLKLARRLVLNVSGGHGPSSAQIEPLPLTWSQERFRSYWGVPKERITAVADAVNCVRPDALVAVGLEALPYLSAAPECVRVWYAADEWTLHHLSLVRMTDTESWSHVRAAGIKCAYERAYASLVDRVWVVSEPERRAMRWFANMPVADVLPNGVDGEYFAPRGVDVVANSAVFWGHLSFEPNVHAVEWFVAHVWPLVREAAPDATFTIVGSKPSPRVTALGKVDGVFVIPDLEDLRDTVSRAAVVALPLVSGGGIKNKALEAASLGKPIVGTPRVLSGLREVAKAPLLIARQPREFADDLLALWHDARRRLQMGRDGREWVLRYHSWEAAARDAIAGIEESLTADAVTVGTE